MRAPLNHIPTTARTGVHLHGVGASRGQRSTTDAALFADPMAIATRFDAR